LEFKTFAKTGAGVKRSPTILTQLNLFTSCPDHKNYNFEGMLRASYWLREGETSLYFLSNP